MNMLASGFANFINGIFANWQLLLFAVAAVLLLLMIVFRKFKLLTVILALIAAGIGVALLINLIISATKWGLPDFVRFLVKWVPTVLFTVTVLLATLIGMKRGLRKSLILLAHEVAIAALCIILYALLVKLPEVDVIMLNVVDVFFGGSGSFAAALGVKAHCSGLKDVFVEWLPTVLSGDFGIMLSESKAYIYTLADLIYHVAFALILYIVFLVLDFVMYLIYLFCYPERRYKKKINKMFTENKVDRCYTKHHAGGGVVGLVRGVAIGLLSLSFMGTALYVVAGRGDGKMKDFDFGDKNINEYYSVYRSIESYGTYGIFKVLNSISSTEDVPYYLFAADLVFSGELDDEEFGISDNIVFREELSAYTDFARDTLDLLLKYGGDEIRPLIKGQATDGAFDVVLGVISKEGFRNEFNDLVSEFDAKTYIINFAMSFVNSAVANLDDMSFAPAVSAENRELLKIMFTKGYLSEAIPDEKIVKDMFAGTPIQIVQPYINISKLASKKDIQIVFNLVLDVLGQKVTTTDDVLQTVADVLPQVRKISLLSENRAEELDPVLGRLYAYAVNCYLTEEGAEGVAYEEIYCENIEWVSEINAFLDAAEASVKLYGNVAAEGKPLDAVISVFDKDNPDYEQNIKYYDSITRSVLSSRILGKTLTTSKMYTLIESALGGLFEGIYIPHDLVYETVYNDKNEPVQKGEMYNVMYGLSAIGKNSDLLSMFADFDKNRDMEKFLKALSETVVKEDENGGTLAEYIVQSKLLRSVISAALINYGADYAYVPTVAREKNADGDPVKFIKAEELTALFDSLSDFVDFILPVLQDGEADMTKAIADFVEKDVFTELLESSTIFEGTLALHLVNALKDDSTVIIPQSLKDDLDGWVTSGSRQGEIKNLLGALDAAQIKIADIVGGEFDGNSILDRFSSEEFTEKDLQTCLKSSVLHYTTSNFLTGGDSNFGSFKLIVPEVALQNLEDDSIPALVRKSEVETVLRLVKELELSEETDVSAVLKKLVQEDNKRLLSESYILSASIVGSLVDNPDVSDMLRLSDKFTAEATPEKLKVFNASNPWKSEIVRLITALDEIMRISLDEEFEFSETKMTDSLSDFLKNMNAPSRTNVRVTRLSVSYASEVVRGAITTRLDDLLEGNIDESILDGAKSGDGYFTEKELKSLSDVFSVFDIDAMDLDADGLADRIKSEILSLNDPADPEEYGENRTKLSVVYPSVIFSGIMSKSLDDVLLGRVVNEGGGDEEGEPAPASEPLIDENVLYDIKGGSARYKQSVIADLISAIKALDYDDLDGLNDLDMDTALDNIEDIDTVCASVILRGVFTKQIGENNTLGVDHPLAYEEDIKVIRANEIKAIANLADKLEDFDEEYFEDVPLSKIKASLFNDNGSVKSYLILKAVSDSIKESAYLIVDRALVDRYGCVYSDEVLLLIDAFEVMFDAEASISTLATSGGFSYPTTAQQREVIMQSRIAMAKISDQLVKTNSSVEIFVGTSNLEIFTDTNDNRRALISYDEMDAVFKAIDACTDGKSFTIPVINTQTLQKYNAGQIDALYASDVLRYRICDYILEQCDYILEQLAKTGQTVETQQAQAYSLSDLQIVTKEVITKEKVNELKAYLK